MAEGESTDGSLVRIADSLERLVEVQVLGLKLAAIQAGVELETIAEQQKLPSDVKSGDGGGPTQADAEKVLAAFLQQSPEELAELDKAYAAAQREYRQRGQDVPPDLDLYAYSRALKEEGDPAAPADEPPEDLGDPLHEKWEEPAGPVPAEFPDVTRVE